MSLNWKELENNIKGMRSFVEGSQLQKIGQLGELALNQGLLLRGYSSKKGAWRAAILLMDKHTGFFFLPDNADLGQSKAPDIFTMILKKHIIGEKIHYFRQIEGERICWIEFANKKVLVLELIPRRSNAVLLEELDEENLSGKCLGSFHRVSLSKGASYSLLKPKKFVPKDVRDFSEYREKSFSERVAHYFYDILNKEDYTFKKKEMMSILKRNLKKINSSIVKAKVNEKGAVEASRVRDQALALLENLYKLPNKISASEKSINLEIPSKNKTISVKVDPSLSYAENADKLFKKAKKINKAKERSEAILTELYFKKEGLEGLMRVTEASSSREELNKLEVKFLEKGLLKQSNKETSKGKIKKGVAEKSKPYLELVSSDGFYILCGRNQQENREVTFRAARGNDIWMHVKQTGGSHVVIKSQKNKSIPLQTLLEAAQLALYYSKVRNSKKIEVDYTFRKNVKAIKGTIAKVTYTANKSLVVDSDPSLMKKVLQKNSI